jgi:hypothetical protein
MMFFRLLMSGRFVRPRMNARWEPIKRPDEVARRLYEQFPQAVDLRFSLYYRKPDRICSTLEEHFGKETGRKRCGKSEQWPFGFPARERGNP